MGASSRMRTFQYLSRYRDEGWECHVVPFFSDDYLAGKYAAGRYSFSNIVRAYWGRVSALLGARRYDLVWIEKECLPWLPSFIEGVLLKGVPYAVDFDDAVFHNYDMHRNRLVRKVLGAKIDKIMGGASLVVAGNSYLAARAHEASARRVEIVPTVVDLSRYAFDAPVCDELPRVVWIGSPSTVKYLQMVYQPLRILGERVPFVLRVVGGVVDMPGVKVELFDWSEETEVKSLRDCDVGIMPLADTAWEKGKCAYKLIQYMACALPTVSSPVGANRDVVLEGLTGYFADSCEDWVAGLERLLTDKDLGRRMGMQGRLRVEQSYSLQAMGDKMVTLLRDASRRT